MQFIAPFLRELLSECNALINCRNGTNVLLILYLITVVCYLALVLSWMLFLIMDNKEVCCSSLQGQQLFH